MLPGLANAARPSPIARRRNLDQPYAVGSTAIAVNESDRGYFAAHTERITPNEYSFGPLPGSQFGTRGDS